MPYQHAYQPRTQEHAQAVRQGFNNGGNVGSTVQNLGYVGENLRAAMLFARDLTQASRFQQTTELSGKHCGLGSKVFIKKFFIRIVEQGDSADNLVQHYNWRSQEGPGVKLHCCWILHRIQVISEERTPLPYRFGGHCTVVWPNTEAYKALGHLAAGVLSH
jgi:hypothetical protein